MWGSRLIYTRAPNENAKNDPLLCHQERLKASAIFIPSTRWGGDVHGHSTSYCTKRASVLFAPGCTSRGASALLLAVLAPRVAWAELAAGAASAGLVASAGLAEAVRVWAMETLVRAVLHLRTRLKYIFIMKKIIAPPGGPSISADPRT